MKNIHLISTDKPSKLFTDLKGKLMFNNDWTEIPIGRINQYIYITSDEEIKEGEYNVPSDFSKIEDITKTSKEDLKFVNNKFNGYKKIILTTDPDLIAYGVKSIDEDFLQWFINNSSCEYVEVNHFGTCCGNQLITECINCEKYNAIYKIIIPKEEPKQEYNFYEKLKEHFEVTPRYKLLEEWEKSSECDKIGITVEEFLEEQIFITQRRGEKIIQYLDKYKGQSIYNDIAFAIEFGYQLRESEECEEFIEGYNTTKGRYDSELFTPPFRLGRKQKKAVLDSKGLTVIVMPHNSEKQAQMYCDYLNGL